MSENTNGLSAVARKNGVSTMGHITMMKQIDALPNGGRNYVIVPAIAHNPKAPGSQAHQLWELYGSPDAPKHTVATFMEYTCGERSALRDRKGLRFTTSRVRADLLHGLSNGLLRLELIEAKADAAA